MKILSLIVIAWLALLSLTASVEAGRVERVEVAVSAEANLPPLVRERMEKSVAAIAEQLLMGADTVALERSKAEKERVIHEVFDKVLIGYTVAGVEITPGENTAVTVKLWPWQDVIGQVKTDIVVEGMPPPIADMVLEDAAGAEDVFRAALLNLPLAATDWTNGVLRKRLNEYLADRLPEFRADFELNTGEVTEVSLTLYPRLPVIRTVELVMRSDTLPNIALMEYRDYADEKTKLLIGVPVSFAARHSEEICRLFADYLDDAPLFRQGGIRSHAELTAGENARIVTHSDAENYRLSLTGHYDVKSGDEDNNLMLRAYFARRLSKPDEVFLQTDVYPRKMDWRWGIGYARDLWFGAKGAVHYDIGRHNFKLGLEQNFARDWRLRYEYRFDDRVGEAGLAYKVHDFFQIEYVIDRYDSWLRLIGHF